MIFIEVTLSTTPEHRDAVVALLKKSMTGAQAEAGCITYRFTVDLDDPQTFHLIELWQDEASLKGHFTGEPFKNFLKEMPALAKMQSSTARIGDLQPYQLPR